MYTQQETNYIDIFYIFFFAFFFVYIYVKMENINETFDIGWADKSYQKQ